MADLVSPIVDIISRLWPCCARHTRYLCKLQENKILLRNALAELKEARDDVQRKVVEAEADPNEPKKRTDPVSGWLQRVETIESEVEVILQKLDEQQLGRRGIRCLIRGCCPPKKCWSNYKLGKSVVMKKASVDELMGKGQFEELTYRLPQPSVQDMNMESTVGMESMFDKVWRLINNTSTADDKPVRNIIGLYGPGGVGKTTLLEKINNEFHNKISTGEHGFDYVVIFEVVSKPVNYKAIQMKIGERLGLSNSLEGDGDEKSRAQKIFNALRKKNYVLLLDDIWEDQSGEQFDKKRIGIPIHPPPPQGNSSSSKLIFTTRSERVCGLMEATHTFQVECLPWEKAWSLFQDKVGEKALNSFSGACELVKDVAKECGGLPLALITIGRAMSTKKSVQEWRDARITLRRYASEFPGMSDGVLARLKLSYDNLPNETEKSCFCYCALFPEDHSIEIAQLVELWIAEGFLDGFDNSLDEARDRGHTIIGNLKSACLLESSGEYRREKTHVKMHDVIRDLALWIVNDCKSSSSSSSSSNTTGKFLVASNVVCERWRNAERIFLHGDSSNNDLEWEEPPTSPNLRTLLVGFDFLEFSYLSLPQSFFQFTPFLRVLDMSNNYLLTELLPTSICQLSHLEYLSLRKTNIMVLPIELRKLVKLKFLDLSDAQDLIYIPQGVIANLSELQVLKLADSGFNNWGLKEEDGDGGLSLGELDRLKQLKEVTLNISKPLALEELMCNQKLRKICTTLVLTNIRMSKNLKSISLLPGNLTSLKYLSISWGMLEELILFINDGGGETNTTTTTSAAGLPISNNNKLEQLNLVHLPRLNNIVCGEKYHHYMAAAEQPQPHYLHYASPFQNLYSITIVYCNALKDLTWVVYMENLENLTVSRCEGTETILELGDDHGLEEGASGGGRVFRRLKTLQMSELPKLKSICNHALVFPSIESISIYESPKLKKLPLDSRSNINNTLQKIEGGEEWWNELQWEDETIKSKFLPYFREGSN